MNNNVDNLKELVYILDKLSYKSNLSKSLKNSLHKFQKEDLINEIFDVRNFYENTEELKKPCFEYRIKSVHSALLKYNKYFPDTPLKKCFNDLLGIRIIVNQYDEILSQDLSGFKVVDMTQGKRTDDGYRGLHLYYQKNNFYYPIEIQINTEKDRMFNDWLHVFVYKNYDKQIGYKLRKMFDRNQIKSEKEFEEMLKNVLFNCKKI
ncbi:hypothetical protein [Faecalibacillus faecis]|uniref:hypothetical protein n=1 Tax=Faecalibacillus faecis TaxID=1982628 RepID=UPI003866EE74